MRASWAVLAALLAAPSVASAEAVAVEVSGRQAERIADALREGLAEEPGLDVVSGDAFGVARVDGQVARVRRRWRVRLRVRSAAGEELARETLSARGLGGLVREVRAWAEDELAPRLATAPPEPIAEVAEPELAPEPARVATPAPRPAAPAPAEPEEDAPRLPAPFAMRAGFAVVNRSLTYNDDVFGALAPYELPAAPVVTVGLEWFPGGHVDLGPLSGLSVHAEGELGLGLQTVSGNGTVHPTQLWALGAGVRYRLRIDDIELGVDAGYRGYAFTIQDVEEEAPNVPSVEIHALRAGAGVRWDIGSGLFFSGSGAYLAPLTLGEIASEPWFPRASAGGVEADAAFGIAIDDIELRAAFSMRRFFYAMNPEPGDARVAGGAVDQSLSGALELTYAPR